MLITPISGNTAWSRERDGDPLSPRSLSVIVDGVSGDLGEEVRTIAETFAKGDRRLDFTLASVGVLDEALDSGAIDDEGRVKFAAYLGEVLRRHSRDG